MTQNSNTDSNSRTHSTADGDIATLWLIDDDAALRLILADTFTDANLNVVSFTQAQAAWTRLNDILQEREPRANLPDVILTDIRMPLMDGLSFSDWVHKQFPELPIIIMTAHSDLTSAINSYQAGAFEYLPKPFDLDDAVATIYKAINYQPSTNERGENENRDDSIDDDSIIIKDIDSKPLDSTPMKKKGVELNHNQNTDNSKNNKAKSAGKTKAKTKSKNKNPSTSADINEGQPSQLNSNTGATTHSTTDSPINTNNNPSGIIGQSQAMQTVFRAIGRLAQSPITVLITGESGTGKELVAGALHEHSPRAQQSFIALNMAAIPHDLIESELFGHEKGAFTGATTQRQGRFEQADGGTLFLDEIGDMPFSTQTRLLRVLANGEFYRVGGQQPVKVDVRIIAATHQNLEHLVQQGKFREDLFYRLNVIRMPLPPLRNRREDIPALATYFMQRAAEQMNTAPKQLQPQTMQIMQAFDWRGNVRQLENVCLWLTVMTTGDSVMSEDLPPELLTAVATESDSHESQHIIQADYVNNQQIIGTQAQDNEIDTRLQPTGIPSFSPNLPSWQQALAVWAQQALEDGKTDILQTATPDFERVLLTAALNHSDGKKIAAANLLGWGRNTLTRKLQQLEVSLETQTKQ